MPIDDVDGLNEAAELAAELSSPVRLGILRYLAAEGPARVKELAQQINLPEPQLSNHLRRLREKNYVEVAKQGRAATYRLTDPRISDVVSGLLAATGTSPHVPVVTGHPELMFARSCYDHVAGELGVHLCEGLLERNALVTTPEGLALGPDAEPCFATLGVGMTSLPPRRKLAALCPDWSHERFHLGGALGAALLTGLMSKDWVRAVAKSRQLELTAAGRRGLTGYLSA
jgi:DNA-binding transcriptional ArsR family regulator